MFYCNTIINLNYMKASILSAMLFSILCSCGISADHFPSENETKRDYLENTREEYNPPRDKGDVEQKAEDKTEINNEIEE